MPVDISLSPWHIVKSIIDWPSKVIICLFQSENVLREEIIDSDRDWIQVTTHFYPVYLLVIQMSAQRFKIFRLVDYACYICICTL